MGSTSLVSVYRQQPPRQPFPRHEASTNASELPCPSNVTAQQSHRSSQLPTHCLHIILLERQLSLEASNKHRSTRLQSNAQSPWWVRSLPIVARNSSKKTKKIYDLTARLGIIMPAACHVDDRVSSRESFRAC